MKEANRTRVVIVGAGPAGIRAAEALVQAGLRPIVVDEALKAGGQIYRRPPDGFVRTPKQLYAKEAGKARALHACFDGLVTGGSVVHRPGASAIALRDSSLFVLDNGKVEAIAFDRIVLATGARDRLAPVRGWQHPGVFTLGATQIALKAQGVALGRRIVLAGSGPLLTLVASQLVKAGANVAAVLDTSSLRQQLCGWTGLAARPPLALRGAAMRLRLGRLYKAGVTLEEIEADHSGVTAIRWRDSADKIRHTHCDMVGLGWHLTAETILADLAGCIFEYNETWRQWLPAADGLGRGGDGIYLAGDCVRILGADGAEVSGRLAAAALLSDIGIAPSDVAGNLRQMRRLIRFAGGLARSFPWPHKEVRGIADGTVVCRCEGITAAQLREAVDYGGADANRVKSLSRIGMGRCQGRYCELAQAELVAARAGCVAKDVGRLRGQAPVRPLPASALMEAAET
jgi:NADPH-dependent 2,4-dienoyl-CoA reductase/sulfur reductase-like enzyme